ncbi:putative Protein Shroom3 [Hypsibius exemplaris]|uniref:ASD2 domain-containing protein n=1 Tax=Hypsibius exemplaris TaxID=2072580 RepID=A0A1W0WBP5_HYPEX|nr:putative Protein Shroom3 [Hypsibius exemplaris]
MTMAAPEATYQYQPPLQSPLSPSASTGQQRGSLSSPRASSSSQLLYSDDSSLSTSSTGSHSSHHSDLIGNMSSRRQSSIDAYPMCGLPSGTLYRKSTSSASLRSPSSASITPLDMPYMRPLSGANVMAPGAPSVFRPIRNSTVPEEFVETYRSTTTTRNEFSGPPPVNYPMPAGFGGKTSSTNPIASFSASALGAKSQKMMELLNSHHTGTSKNLYHATPTGQWSQTESSTATLYHDDHAQERAAPQQQPQKRPLPKSQSVDVALSATFRGAPTNTIRVDAFVPPATAAAHASDCSRSGSERFPENCCDFKQQPTPNAAAQMRKGNTMTGRSPLAPIPVNTYEEKRRPPPLGLIKQTDEPSSGINSAPGMAVSHRYAEQPTSPASGVKAPSVGFELRSAMPALRPNHFIALPEVDSKSPSKSNSAQQNGHLTTVKEVRTYQIRPSLGSPSTATTEKESTRGMDSPNGSMRSSPSHNDERRHRHSSSHTRDASLDSHVSWQSNSTASSGYSSVALSSSTPTLDVSVSEETLVPEEYGAYPGQEETRNSDFAVSRSVSKLPVDSSSSSASTITPSEPEVPHRSISVSEMIRNFGSQQAINRTPPHLPPKPRYAHLPAHRPDPAVSQSAPKVTHFERSRGNSIPSDSVSASYSMEDIREYSPSQARRSSVATAPISNIPVRVEEARKEVNQATKNASPLPSPPLSVAGRGDRDLPLKVTEKTSTNPTKPVPMFRTAVHGLHLGANAKAAAALREEPVTVEDPPAARASLEDRGYGSGEIHYYGGGGTSPVEMASEGGRTKTGVRDLTFASLPEGDDGGKADPASPVDQEDLLHAKDNLTASLSERIDLLKEEQHNLQQDMMLNDEQAADIMDELARVASSQDVARFKQHLKELEEMTSLTISLTCRLGKVARSIANLRVPSDELEATTLQDKKRKLESQYEDALYLQKGVERRRQGMRSFLKQCLSVKQFEEYEDFFTTRESLLRDARNMDDKIRMGEEQLRCLRLSGSN